MSAIKHVATLASGLFAEKVLGFVALIVYARIFSAEQLAIMPFSALCAGMALVVFLGGLQPLILRDFPKGLVGDREVTLKKITAARHLSGAASIGCFVIFFVLGRVIYLKLGFPPIDNFAFAALSGFIAIQLHQVIQFKLLVVLSKYSVLSRLGVVRAILQPCLVVVLYNEYGFNGFMYGLFLSSLIVALIADGVVRAQGSVRYGLDTIKHLFFDSRVFYLEGFVMYFRGQGDNFVTAVMLGPTVLGAYFIGKRLVELTTLFAKAVDHVITPALSRLSEGGMEKFKGELTDASEIVLYLAFVIVACLLCAQPLYFLLMNNPDLYPIYIAISVLSLRVFTDLVKSTVIARVVFVLFPAKERLYMTLLEAIVLVPLLFVLSYFFGVLGVSIATVVAGVVSGFYGHIIIRRKISFTVIARSALVNSLLLVSVIFSLYLWQLHYPIGEYYLTDAFSIVKLALSLGLLGLAYVLMTLCFRTPRLDGALRRYVKRR